MLRKAALLLVVLPTAILLIALTVANRHAVTLSFDPFSPLDPAFGLEMPVFLLVFATLLAGIVIGGIATWLTQGTWRKSARANRAAAHAATREAAELRREVEKAHAALPAPGRGS